MMSRFATSLRVCSPLWYGLLAVGGACCLFVGCGQMSTGNPAKVAELAKTWPPYQRPQVSIVTPGSQMTVREPVAPRLDTSSIQRPQPPVRPIVEWGLEETAIDSLGRIGAPAVPALMRSLQNPQPAKRVQAANVLGRIGPEAHQSVPELVRALYDPDLEVRKAATRALGQIGPAAEEAVGPLLEIVESP